MIAAVTSWSHLIAAISIFTSKVHQNNAHIFFDPTRNQEHAWCHTRLRRPHKLFLLKITITHLRTPKVYNNRGSVCSLKLSWSWRKYHVVVGRYQILPSKGIKLPPFSRLTAQHANP